MKAKEESEALHKVLEEQAQIKKRQKISHTEDKEHPVKRSDIRSGSSSGSSSYSDSDSSDGDTPMKGVVTIEDAAELAARVQKLEAAKKQMQMDILMKSKQIYLGLP
jgi:hypothetical protein